MVSWNVNSISTLGNKKDIPRMQLCLWLNKFNYATVLHLVHCLEPLRWVFKLGLLPKYLTSRLMLLMLIIVLMEVVEA